MKRLPVINTRAKRRLELAAAWPAIDAQMRPCGECRVCCTVLMVEGVTRAGEPCKHLTEGGCGVHAHKPRFCADYACLWKALPDRFPEDMRPDKSGLLLGCVTKGGRTWYTVHQREPGLFMAYESAAIAERNLLRRRSLIASRPAPTLTMDGIPIIVSLWEPGEQVCEVWGDPDDVDAVSKLGITNPRRLVFPGER